MTRPQEAAWWSAGVSLFAGIRQPRPVAREMSWDGLCEALTRFRVGESKDALPLWSPALYPPHTEARRKALVESVSCLVLDYDGGTTLRAAHATWKEWPHIMHTSWSHTPEHHKFRVVVPLLAPVPADGWARVFAWAQARAPTIDTQCSDPSRVFYVPSHAPDAVGAWAKAWQAEGRGFLRLRPDELPKTPQEEAAEQAAKRPRRMLGVGTGRGAGRRALSDALKTDAGARRAAAERLGATISETATPRADHITCPSCGRPSVHFMLTPGAWNGARCSHRNSCGWAGWVDQLLEQP